MSDIAFLVLFYAVAMLVLTAEIFLPSHGILTIVGLTFLIIAIVKTFEYGETAGAIAIGTSLVVLPTIMVVAVKVWPSTWIGRRIAPMNPVYSDRDLGDVSADLEPLIGKCGLALTPLRPVGTCEIDGRRLECISEAGMVDAGVTIRAVGVRGRNIEVAIAEDQQKT
jgi:membrane-bound ClpP family serine protease